MKTTLKKCLLSARSNHSEFNKRIFAFLLMAMIFTFGTYAADTSSGAEAITLVKDQVKTYVSQVRELVYVIAAVISIVGAFNIYHKMTNGDQDVKKTIMLTIGGCIGLIAMATALPKFFGY